MNLQTSDRSSELSEAFGAFGPVLDAATLAQLHKLDAPGEHKVMTRVLRTYDRALGRSLDELDAALSVHDSSTVARLVHTLRSSSACVGALGFAALCKELETLLRDRTVDDLKVQTQAIQLEGRRVQLEVSRMLAPPGSPR